LWVERIVFDGILRIAPDRPYICKPDLWNVRARRIAGGVLAGHPQPKLAGLGSSRVLEIVSCVRFDPKAIALWLKKRGVQ